MNYLTIKETALRWGVSERTVNKLCTAGRIEGAVKHGNVWAIPENAEKPDDPRRERVKQKQTPSDLEKNMPLSVDNNTEKPIAEAPQRSAMPLLNTPFKIGHVLETIGSIEDRDSHNIALAEYFYFSGQPENASDIAEMYLTHEDVALRVSACWIFAYANLALDRIQKSKRAMEVLQALVASVNDETPLRDKALITCCSTGASVLLHLPLPKILSPLKTYIHMMPPGLRLFVLYIEAHHAYLNRQYGVAVGIAETALALESEIYPIPTIYLHMVACMGYMNMKHPEMAREHLIEAWKVAQPDDLIEAFGEHHGLLGGTLESVLKKDYPEDFKQIINITYKFSAGWRKVHNPDTGNSVADNLTTTEFSIAMLAARGWTNQEIADHMNITEITVRNIITNIIQKLNVKSRFDFGKFMLR